MHFLLILIFTEIAGVIARNVGSTLFLNRCVKDCWNENDVAKLKARKFLEDTFPKDTIPSQINVKYVKDSIRCFTRALNIAAKEKDPQTAKTLRTVLADTIGGHLNCDILPSARFAYYAGYVPFRSVRRLHDFFDELKGYLNTQGLGWRRPPRSPKWSNLTVNKIRIGNGKFADPCVNLVYKRDNDSCIHFPTPKMDDAKIPSAVALPFKSDGLVSLVSPVSENILLKYYTTASRCILQKSPASCRHADFVNFNNEVWRWLKRDVAPHLMDEKLYSAYGGVLRIATEVQSYGKGLSRRNLFEYSPSGGTLLHPWNYLSKSYIYVDADWTPKVYIGFVLLAAVSIGIFQMCYSYFIGYPGSCQCLVSKTSKADTSKESSYAKGETHVSTIKALPSIFSLKDKKCLKHIASKIKTSSTGSKKPPKLHDLSSNTERLLQTIMKNDDASESEQCDEHYSTSSQEKKVHERSPPRIETPISQVKLNRSSRSTRKKSEVQTFSTTSTSRGKTECYSDSVWSSSSSCSSDSISSVTYTGDQKSSRVKDRKNRSRCPRRFATKSTLGTDLNGTSFSTPPSHR